MSSTFNLLVDSFPLLVKGLIATMQLSFSSIAMGLSCGIIIGTASCRKLRVPGVAHLFDAYVFCMRGIPFFVQLLIVYFVLPDMLHLNLSPFTAGALALGLCSTGYVAEIVRAGINSLPDGQWSACYVLGYSRYQMLRHIIFPQALAMVIPALSNELISVVLSTSIISQIGTLELTKVGANIIAREMNPMVIYTTIALLYLIVTTIISFGAKMIEKRLQYDA